MAARKTFADTRPWPGKVPAPVTAPGNTRSFDMRPKLSDRKRREDPAERAIRPSEPAVETLLDDPE